ncbi:MAG: hypothetical protein ACLFOY_06030 [Desulfatibacillaceae bacterium]
MADSRDVPIVKRPVSLAGYDLLLLALLILATRTATVLHEFLGHALWAILFGGEVHAVRVSLFGGGGVESTLPATSGSVLFVYSLSGIGVNFATGSAALAALRWKRTPQPIGLFLALFAAASLMGSLAYLVLGIYHGVGDPVAWADPLPLWYGSLWLPLLLCAPLCGRLAARACLAQMERAFPDASTVGRLGRAAATFGVAFAAYLLLFVATNQNLASADAPQRARVRAEQELLAKKRLEMAEKLAREHPGWSRERVLAEAAGRPVQVAPGEVPERFPIIPVFAVLSMIGAITAAFGVPAPRVRGRPGAGVAVVAAVLAVVVLLLLYVTGGLLYGGP